MIFPHRTALKANGNHPVEPKTSRRRVLWPDPHFVRPQRVAWAIHIAR